MAQVIYYFGFAASFSLLVVLVTDDLDASAVAFGIVLATGAAGAFLGSLAEARISSAMGARATSAGTVALQGAALAALAAAASLPVVAALWFVNGIRPASNARSHGACSSG